MKHLTANYVFIRLLYQQIISSLRYFRLYGPHCMYLYNLNKGFIYGDFLFIEVILLFVYFEIIYLIYFYINKGDWEI